LPTTAKKHSIQGGDENTKENVEDSTEGERSSRDVGRSILLDQSGEIKTYRVTAASNTTPAAAVPRLLNRCRMHGQHMKAPEKPNTMYRVMVVV
jgi:hypothetical protein